MRILPAIPSLSLMIALAAAAPGCAAPAEEAAIAGEDAIVDVAQGAVESQALNNCWIYAHASWIESLHARVGGRLDVSQSYWTYWHMFDSLSGGAASYAPEGSWTTANRLVRSYGLMSERDFVRADTTTEKSARQAQALAGLKTSLASGPLRDPAVRRDRERLRAELDRIWDLGPEQRAAIDRAFGKGVTRDFTSGASAAETKILPASDLAVAYSRAPSQPLVRVSLAQAIREWEQVSYPSGASARRQLLTRVQRALHDGQPVYLTWFVDMNARGPRGDFDLATLAAKGPGSQGIHMVVVDDYQARLADGTVLEAGDTLDPARSRDRALLARALEPATKIEFLRVKNSWGTASGERGYNDLHLDYLDGPIARCEDPARPSTCRTPHTPLRNVVLPPGY